MRTNRLQQGEDELLLDVRGDGQLVHQVLVNPGVVGGQVAGLVSLPDVRLVVGPSGLRLGSPANIEQTTRTGYGINEVDSLTIDGRRDGEASSWKVRGSYDGGEGCFTANFTGAAWGLVEASGGRWRFRDCKGVASQDAGKVWKLSVGDD